MRFKFFGFNVCSLVQPRRLEEIATFGKHYPVHALVGTRLRAQPDGAVRRQTMSDHDYLHFGYGRGPYTNRSAGVSIGLRRRDLATRIHRVVPGPPAALGRAGLARVISGSVDLTVVALYFPPPGPRGTQASWRRTVDVLMEWLSAQLDATPERSTPLIFADLNDSFAADDTSDGYQCVGPFVQDRMGYASRCLREVMHRHFLGCATTFRRISPTFYGEKSATYIDHFVVPTGLLPRITKLLTMTKAARVLQLFPSQGTLRDHAPLLLEADVGVPSLQNGTAAMAWNFDAIETALQTPGLRESFLTELNDAMRVQSPAYLGYFESNCIDDGYRTLLDTLLPIAKKHFGRARRAPGATLAEHRALVRQLLRHRARLRELSEPHAFYDTQIRDYTNRIKWEVRRWSRSLRRTWTEGLHDAWRRRDLANVQYFCRRLSGTGLGPKRRNYSAVRCHHASADELATTLGLPGNQGGLSAVRVSLDDFLSKRAKLAPRGMQARDSAEVRGGRDLHKASWVLRRSCRRRSVPPWSLPGEIWLMLLKPSYYSKPRPSPFGLGAKPDPPEVKFITSGLGSLATCWRACGRFPTCAGFSIGWQTPKPDGGTRFLHGLCPLFRAVARGVYSSVPHGAPAVFDHGCIPHRRRENAILGVHVLSERLRTARVWHVSVFDDMKNAFGCCDHSRMDRGLMEYLPSVDADLLADRRTTHILHIDGVDSHVHLHLQSGALMGDPSAPDEFRVDFARPLGKWLEECQDPLLVAQCSLFDEKVYGGLFKYVDDLAYFLLLASGSLAEAVSCTRASQASLGAQLEAFGYRQNTKKQVLVPRLCGYNANRKFYSAQVGGARVAPHTRYLGPQFLPSGAFSHQMHLCKQAANRGWLSFKYLWPSGAPFKVKRLVFISVVQGALLSGLTPYLLTEAQEAQLDVALLGKIRCIAAGAMCDRSGAHPKSWDSRNVFKWMNIVPSRIELLVQRLRWYQAIVRWPESHQQVIAVLFGQFGFEEFPTVVDGRLTPHANAFALRFVTDVYTLKLLTDFEDWPTVWGENLYDLFHDEYIKHLFLSADVSVLRGIWRSGNTELDTIDFGDPLDFVRRSSSPYLVQDCLGPDACMFVCDCTTDDGNVCGARFLTHAALVAHKTHTIGGSHGDFSYYARCVVTNECPACRSSFAFQKTAKAHLCRAFRRGFCATESAHAVYPVVPPKLVCPACKLNTFVDLAQLQTHICEQHFPFVPVRAPPRAAGDGGPEVADPQTRGRRRRGHRSAARRQSQASDQERRRPASRGVWGSAQRRRCSRGGRRQQDRQAETQPAPRPSQGHGLEQEAGWPHQRDVEAAAANHADGEGPLGRGGGHVLHGRGLARGGRGSRQRGDIFTRSPSPRERPPARSTSPAYLQWVSRQVARAWSRAGTADALAAQALVRQDVGGARPGGDLQHSSAVSSHEVLRPHQAQDPHHAAGSADGDAIARVRRAAAAFAHARPQPAPESAGRGRGSQGHGRGSARRNGGDHSKRRGR